MAMQNTSRQLPAAARGMTSQYNGDNESDDSLDACFQSSISPSSNHVNFSKMERALNIALQPSGDNDFRSSSLNGCVSNNVGNIMGMQSTENSDLRNADDKSIQTEGDANRLARAKTQALSLKANCQEIQPTDKPIQQSDSPSYSDDEDYVANMVADIRRRRGKKKIQQTYWQTYDSEQRELDGESSAPVSSYIDDKITDNSTIFSDRSSHYSESEDDESAMDESYGSYYDVRRRRSRRNPNKDILEMINDLCVGNTRCDISDRVTRTHRDRREEKIKREHAARREASDAQEDATLEGTIFSEYSREDTTLTGTVLSDCTKEETIMSGSTTEYDMPSPIKSDLMAEPNFLPQDGDIVADDNQATSDSAFVVMHNLCSNYWFRCGKEKGDAAKEVDNKTNESEVTAQRVKEHLDRIQQSCSQGLEETIAKEETIEQYKTLQQECLNTCNNSMGSSNVILQRSQSELKAIYERNKAKSNHNKQTSLQLDSTKTADYHDCDDDDKTVEMSNRQPKNESIEVVETAASTKQTRKWFRPKLFSRTIKKRSTVQIKPTSSCPPVSPARTAATTGTSDSSEQSNDSVDEDDDVCASYAELAITRTSSKTLISI